MSALKIEKRRSKTCSSRPAWHAAADPTQLAAEWRLVDEHQQTQTTASIKPNCPPTLRSPATTGKSAGRMCEGPKSQRRFCAADRGRLTVKTPFRPDASRTPSDKLNGTPVRPDPTGKRTSASRRRAAQRAAAGVEQLPAQLQNYRTHFGRPGLGNVHLPTSRDSLRTYAELMTMSTIQSSRSVDALGNDPANYKLPWSKAAENPRSYGVTAAVPHDGLEP